MRDWFGKIAGGLDARDGLLAVGLLLLAGGLAFVSVPAALAIPGCVLVAIAVFGVRGE